jgi:hypothetical protein
MRITFKRIEAVQQGVDEVRLLANEVEAHGRRWSLRFMGLPAPVDHIEKKTEAKAIVLKFLADRMNIVNFHPNDIDTAHRIGPVQNSNQTILLRFFRRENADFILASKKMLKGTTFSIFGDATRLNKKLQWDLSNRAEVESAWSVAGKVWCKLRSGGTKLIHQR